MNIFTGRRIDIFYLTSPFARFHTLSQFFSTSQNEILIYTFNCTAWQHTLTLVTHSQDRSITILGRRISIYFNTQSPFSLSNLTNNRTEIVRSIQQNMAKKASATINLESDHHVYTQMIDPSNASLSIMTNSNDASNDNHQSTLNCSQQKKSNDQNLGSISSSSAAAAVVPTNCHPNNGVTSHANKNNHNHNGAHDLNDDTESIASHVSFGSSTDGIDVLRGNIGTPNNFFDWSHLIAARLVSSVIYKRTMLFCILLSSLLLATTISSCVSLLKSATAT